MMMFMIGLELSLERLRVMRRLVFGFGLLQFVLCAVAIGAIAYALGAPPVLAAVIGPALSMSSTAVVVQVLSHEKRLGGPVGRASLARAAVAGYRRGAGAVRHRRARRRGGGSAHLGHRAGGASSCSA